ncbi:hypothetical protein [Actinoplanes sp. NBRC 101535]|uniref:YqeB family protein n=1 Tax=Actinoplanes sp. NBRC 101535 TaxID=3032196 RepID=UPI0024A02E0C|nr:hypothetical protein [Actinoplanes sp. NBRC 101535]GLX99984.1 hypothetical protein Acsp01_03640 [Actinoplanes sp. NBRC 101535]
MDDTSSRQPAVLGHSRPDLLLILLGPELLGVLIAVVVPPLARWALSWGTALPVKVLFRLAGQIDTGWKVAIQAVILVVVGALVSVEILRRSSRITVAGDTVRLETDGTRQTLERERVGALFREGSALVVLDTESRQVFRGEPQARAAVVESAFRDFGYPWCEADPFAGLYRRWEPEAGGLPMEVEAVLSARAVALRKKAGKEAGELRDTLQKLGYAVRDEKETQFWRPLVRS